MGALIAFRGDEWLADLIDKVGVVTLHHYSSFGQTMDILVCSRIVPILLDEFEPHEIEILQN